MAELMTKIVTLVIVLVLISSYVLEMIGAVEVTIMDGRLQPREMISRNGNKFFGFIGVPYATPPVQNLRYEAPSAPTPWKGVRKALWYRPACIQYDIFSEKVIGDENCLYLNVFTPKLPNENSGPASKRRNEPIPKDNATLAEDAEEEEESLYPVMVYLHSGAFMFGTSAHYDPKYLMDEKVIFVSLNSRLGSFGYLSTGDDTVSGNMGLKDQVMALRWVQENIHHFNGDKNYVTLVGESSGGAAVHYHMLSPMSRGLFNRAVSMSGTALCPWAFRRDPKKQAKRLATLMNCPTTDMTELLFCLREKNATELAWKHKEFFEWNTDPISPFAPSVEKSLNEQDVFLTDTPYTLIQRGTSANVPWIVGITDEEGLLDAGSVIWSKKLTNEINMDWYRVAPLTFFYRDTALLRDAVSNQIRSYYFGSSPITAKNQANLTNLYSDRYFCHCSRTAALMHKKQNEAQNIYMYIFSFKVTGRTFMSLPPLRNLNPPGVSEGDELSYLFHMNNYTTTFPEIHLKKYKEVDFSKRFVGLWVSFAKTGKPANTWGPTFAWNPISSDEVKGDVALKYYKIDNKTSIVEEPFANRMTFWDNLPLNEFDGGVNGYSRDDAMGDEDDDY